MYIDSSFGWKTGRWSVQETDILQTNLRQYKKVIIIDNTCYNIYSLIPVLSGLDEWN